MRTRTILAIVAAWLLTATCRTACPATLARALRRRLDRSFP